MGDVRGQRFGAYVVLERIAKGGMAEIFLAKQHGHAGFEKLVVLKKIRPRYAEKKVLRRLLIGEAKLAARLTHLNVVQVHDLGELDGVVYIVMEYVRGRDLAAVLSHAVVRRELIPVDIALFVATELVAGLAYAHGARSDAGEPLGIVHRDVSPHNVLISYEGEVKVTDFGIARARLEGAIDQNLRGKFGYMSPEQVNEVAADQRADIFSVGVVFWEMLCGQRLFHSKDSTEAMRRILEAEIPPPSSINANVPKHLDEIVLRMLDRDPDRRPSSMRSVQGKLLRISDRMGRRAQTRELAVYMRRQFGRIGGYQPGLPTPVQPFVPTRLAAAPNTVGALGQVLLELGAVTAADVELALAEQRAGGGRIGELLLASGTIGEDDLAQALAHQAKAPWLSEPDLLRRLPPAELLDRFPRGEAEDLLVVPFDVNADGRSVAVAVSDPNDEARLQEASVVLGVGTLLPHVTARSAIRAAIDAWYDSDAVAEPTHSPEPIGPPVLIVDGDLVTITPLVDQLLAEDCDFVTATTGRDARAIIAERAPIVAVLDADLSDIDGLNLCLEILRHNPNATVFLTARAADDKRRAEALGVGAEDLFDKPLSVSVVCSKIRRALKRHESSHGARPTLRFEGVSGALENMSMLDIVQSLEVGLKNAHVVIQYDDGRRGELGVTEGRVVAAATRTASGDAAFYELVPPGPGLFRIEYRKTSLERSLVATNTALMLRAIEILEQPVPQTDDLILD